MNTPEERFAALNLTLPPAPKPLGVYKPFLQVGNFIYVSGHGTVQADGSLLFGRVGDDMTKEEGKAAAQLVGLAILATLKANLGSLNKIGRVIKVLGMVGCVPDFKPHPYVINGCSELFAGSYLIQIITTPPKLFLSLHPSFYLPNLKKLRYLQELHFQNYSHPSLKSV